ncbi:MAG: tetratricopeptide (TPR) repeat protein [Glaciecola sp.]|jgi:tetratricopeptide (TPR) repeat protein
MKIKSIFLFLALSLGVQAFVFAKKEIFYTKTVEDCEERWVICPQLADGSYQFGFVFDVGDGLTFRMEGAFIIKNDTIFKRVYGKKIDPRPNLNGSTNLVALVPYDRFEDLKISVFPNWYESVDTVNNKKVKNVFELYTEGYVHSRRGEYMKAKVPLEQAYTLNPDYKNLRFQLAKVYNALKMYKEAIPVLQRAIKLQPKHYVLYEQLSHAQLQIGKVPEAEKSAGQGIKRCKINPPRCQMALSLAFYFFDKKNKRKLEKWLREARKYAQDGGREAKQIGEMLEESYHWVSH